MPLAPSSTLPRRALVLALALFLLAWGSADLPGARAVDRDPGPVPAAETGSGATATARTPGGVVTLVTGDRVTVQPGPGDEPRVLFEGRPGEGPGRFTVERDDQGVHVIPEDVAPLVPEVLDPELFNVTRLVEMGYDDERSDALPLIVERAPGVRRLDAGTSLFAVTSELPSIGATAVTLAKAEAGQLGDRLASMPSDRAPVAARMLGGATKIHLDGKVEGTSLDGYLDAVNAPEAWQTGLDGSGVTVAVLDSGVDAGHPALAGQVEAQRDFTDEGSPEDEVGHGTHVASLLAGTGAGADGARQGIAPAADLVSGRVLDADNQGLESWVIAGMEWAVAQDADLVNMSLGGPPAAEDDPVVRALEELTERSDALFVVSAGNRGGLGLWSFTINSPGTAPSALTVGASEPDGSQASFSSEGPTTGSFLLKPDVLAPGVDVLGARAGARDGDLYVPMTGTSMATPIVAGAAALLRQAHPGWTAQQVKARIVSTADGSGWFNAWEDGSGRLDLAAATRAPLVTDTPSLDVGYLAHPDDSVQRQVVAVTNTGSEPMTVAVRDVMTNDRYTDSGDLEKAPATAVTADPAVLEVGPGSSVETVITLDPNQLADTRWQGIVSFQADGRDVLRLPIGVYDEPESYDLDIEVLDRHGDAYDPALAEGDPYANTYAYALNADTGQSYRIELGPDGRGSARVRGGRYSVFAHVATPAAGGAPASTTFAGTAEMLVAADTRYVIDARKGERLDEVVLEGQRTRATMAVGFTYRRASKDGGHGVTVGVPLDPEHVRQGRIFVTPTPPVTTGIFEAALRWQLEPVGRVRPHAPDAYDVVWNRPELPVEMAPPISRREMKGMARLEQVLRPAATSGEHALRTGSSTALSPTGWGFSQEMDLPGGRTVLATARPDVFWQHCLDLEWNWWRGLCRASGALEPGTRSVIEIGGAIHAAAVEARRYPDLLNVEAGYSDGQRRMKVANSEVVEDSRFVLATASGHHLATADGFVGYLPVPEEEERFRLTHEWRLDGAQLHAAPESRTVWEFRAPAGETPLLLDADYGPALDAGGLAPAHRPLPMDLSFEAGGLGPGEPVARIVRAEMWWSSDGGRSWHPSTVRRTGPTTFASRVPARATAPGAELSLRLAARDGTGGSVDQTSIGLIDVDDRDGRG